MDFFETWVENDPSRIETDTNDEEDSETIIVNDIKQENLDEDIYVTKKFQSSRTSRNEFIYNTEIDSFEETFPQYAHDTLFYQSLTRDCPDYPSLRDALAKNVAQITRQILPVFWKIRLRYIYIKMSKAFPAWTKEEIFDQMEEKMFPVKLTIPRKTIQTSNFGRITLNYSSAEDLTKTRIRPTKVKKPKKTSFINFVNHNQFTQPTANGIQLTLDTSAFNSTQFTKIVPLGTKPMKKAIPRLNQPVAGASPKINGNEPMYEPYTQEPATKKQKLNESTELDKIKDNELSQLISLHSKTENDAIKIEVLEDEISEVIDIIPQGHSINTVPKVEFFEENYSILENSKSVDISTSHPTNSEKFVFKKIFLKIDGRYLQRSLCFIFEINGESYVYKVYKIQKETGDPFYTIKLRCHKYRRVRNKVNQTYFGDGCLAEATLNVSIDSVLKFATTNTNFEFKNIHADENLIPENYEIYSFEPVPTTVHTCKMTNEDKINSMEVPEPVTKSPGPPRKFVKDGQFVSMSKRAGTIMPSFQTVEKGIVYGYDSTSFGNDTIYMHCSNKSTGCCATATIKPLKSIVKKQKTGINYLRTRFINPHSEENFKVENYDAETIGRPIRGKGDWQVHTCNGYVPEKQKIHPTTKLSLPQNIGRIIYVSKRSTPYLGLPSKKSSYYRNYPAFYSFENGVIYEYFSIQLGAKVIYMSCSNRDKGCKARANLGHMNNIVETTPKMRFSEPFSEENYKMENYNLSSFKMHLHLTHSCNGFDLLHAPQFECTARDNFLRDFLENTPIVSKIAKNKELLQ